MYTWYQPYTCIPHICTHLYVHVCAHGVCVYTPIHPRYACIYILPHNYLFITYTHYSQVLERRKPYIWVIETQRAMPWQDYHEGEKMSSIVWTELFQAKGTGCRAPESMRLRGFSDTFPSIFRHVHGQIAVIVCSVPAIQYDKESQGHPNSSIIPPPVPWFASWVLNQLISLMKGRGRAVHF